MPNGFWYAGGRKEMEERKPASAFSKGDILTLDSNSSLSRLNPYALAAGTVYAVAAADSTDSIQDRVPVVRVTPETLFWARAVAGSALTTGEASGLSFAAATAGRYWVEGSTTTLGVVVVRGTDFIDQSHESRVQVRFKYAAGELTLS